MKALKDAAENPHPASRPRQVWRPRIHGVIAVAAIVLLIDSEILSVGLPAAQIINHLFGDSVAMSAVTWLLLGLVLAATAVWLAPRIWNVERDLSRQAGGDCSPCR